MSFALLTPEEAEQFKPKVAVLDENNKITAYLRRLRQTNVD